MIKIKTKFCAETVNLLFSRIPSILGIVEYSEFWPQGNQELSAKDFISHTPEGKLRSLYLIWDETGFEISFCNNGDSGITVFMQRFGNYLQTDVGCVDSGIHIHDEQITEPVFDTRRYVRILLDLLKDLVITAIEVYEDYNIDPELSLTGLTHTISIYLGCPPTTDDQKYCGDYLKTIVKNMHTYGVRILNENQLNLFEKNTSTIKDAVIICSWHDYAIKLDLSYDKHLTLTPLDPIKYVTFGDIQFVDVEFYTRFLLLVSEGIGLRELRTYFT